MTLGDLAKRPPAPAGVPAPAPAPAPLPVGELDPLTAELIESNAPQLKRPAPAPTPTEMPVSALPIPAPEPTPGQPAPAPSRPLEGLQRWAGWLAGGLGLALGALALARAGAGGAAGAGEATPAQILSLKPSDPYAGGDYADFIR